MDITGTLHHIGETHQVSEKFRKRDFVLKDTSSQYPQHIQFQLTQDKCDLIDRAIGSEITVHFNLKGREWTSPQGEIKYFNTLEAWRVTGTDNQTFSRAAQNEKEEQSIDPNEGVGSGDDLPF